MPNLRALAAMAKLPVDVGPFHATNGAITPFFNDSRKVYSHPDIFRVFVEELAVLVQQYTDIELIVGIPMAGIPLAVALSIETNISCAYLNKERKETLRRKILEGDYAHGAHTLLVDDTIGYGNTIQKSINQCGEEGVAIKHVMTMYNPWNTQNELFLKTLKTRDITYDTLYTRVEWMDYLVEHGLASEEMREIHNAYLADPTSWHNNRVMWNKFLQWKEQREKTQTL